MPGRKRRKPFGPPNKVGKPSLYKQEYCQQLIDFGATGHTFEAFAGKLGVSKKALYNWIKKHPEFEEAKEIALAKAQLCLESLALDVMKGIVPASQFNPTVFIFWMKNCHGWRDKIDHAGSIGIDFHAQLVDQIETTEKAVIDIEATKLIG